MPTLPLKQCKKPGCSERVERGRHLCEAHRAESNKQYDERRGNSNSRGYGAKWRRLRRLVLNRDPMCKGRVPDEYSPSNQYSAHSMTRPCTKPSTDVDHIITKRDGGRDTMDNLQGLCHECHSRKTATEDGRWG